MRVINICQREVRVRPTTPQERPIWDALMDHHHYLGFRRLPGRGLRSIATFRGQCLGLAAQQNGTLLLLELRIQLVPFAHRARKKDELLSFYLFSGLDIACMAGNTKG